MTQGVPAAGHGAIGQLNYFVTVSTHNRFCHHRLRARWLLVVAFSPGIFSAGVWMRPVEQFGRDGEETVACPRPESNSGLTARSQSLD